MISDEQIIRILSLTAHEPQGANKNGVPFVEWWGVDTTCGTTAELIAQVREILEGEELRRQKELYCGD